MPKLLVGAFSPFTSPTCKGSETKETEKERERERNSWKKKRFSKMAAVNFAESPKGVLGNFEGEQ